MRVDEISRIHVEVRPPPVHQVFVVELTDGTMHDVCPTDWPGAGRLYAKLERKVARARAKRRAVAPPSSAIADAAAPRPSQR